MLLWPLIHAAFKTPSPKFQEEDTCLLLKIRIFFAARERFTNTQWPCFLVFYCRLCTSREYQLGFFLLYLMLKFLLTPFQQHSCFMRWGRIFCLIVFFILIFIVKCIPLWCPRKQYFCSNLGFPSLDLASMDFLLRSDRTSLDISWRSGRFASKSFRCIIKSIRCN